MSKLPRDAVKQYFPFYPSQWLTSRRLRVCSPAARGILIDLMAMAWEDGGKVCEDLDVLAVSMGLSSEDLQTLLDELTRRERITITTRKGSPPTIHVPPLESIYAESLAYIEARRADGKKGADARHKGEGRDPIGTLQAPSREPIGTLSTDAMLCDATVADATVLDAKGKKSSGKTPAARFVPPTVDEVSAYIQEHGYHFEATDFIAYYEVRNWVPNGAKRQMASWKSACTTWEGHWKRDSSPARTPQKSPSNAAHGEGASRFNAIVERSPNNG